MPFGANIMMRHFLEQLHAVSRRSFQSRRYREAIPRRGLQGLYDKTWSDNSVLLHLRCKQISNFAIFDSYVQIGRSDTYIRMPCGIANFRQCSATCQRMGDKCVSPVVNRQRFKPFASKHPASGSVPFTKCMSRESIRGM